MIHTDGRPTIAHRGALEAALAEAQAREDAELIGHARDAADACCGDPGDCDQCGS
jgi:hypothetical protein